MRLGLVIEGDSFEVLGERAALVENAGIDIAWLGLDDQCDSGLLRAAAIGAHTASIRIAASVEIGTHPLEIAEAGTVADNCCDGRLIVVLEDQQGDPALLDETLEVVSTAFRPRPFRHVGARWQIPANLPENDQHEQRVIVTPFAAQLDVPIWLRGTGAGEIARSGARPLIISAGTAVDPLEPEPDDPPRILELDVPTAPDGSFSPEKLVDFLLEHRARWALEIALLRLTRGLTDSAWALAVARLAREVRPRILLDALPAGLDEHWKALLAQ